MANATLVPRDFTAAEANNESVPNIGIAKMAGSVAVPVENFARGACLILVLWANTVALGANTNAKKVEFAKTDEFLAVHPKKSA